MSDEQQIPESSNSIDDEVAELLVDMIALLCNASVDEVKVKPMRGDRSVMFVVDLVKARYRGVLIGREGKTITAIRQYLKAVGGAYRRYYDIDLVGDRSRQRPPPTPSSTPSFTPPTAA